MAPKLWKGAGKSGVLKRPAAKKSKVTAPSTIKGLAGFKKASTVFTGAVDKGVSGQNAALASRAEVLPALDARLVFIDASINSDKYYVLQGLEDTKIPEGKPNRCYAYQRWGRTGTGGTCQLQGPWEQKRVEAHMFKVFKKHTGMDWGALKPGEKAKPGKYWLARPSEGDSHAVWEYFADDGIDGKGRGWYPYDSEAVENVEELFAEHKANKGGENATGSRFVTSGSFTYCLDFEKLTQRNASTGKLRQIRRSISTASSWTSAKSSPAGSGPALSRVSSAGVPRKGAREEAAPTPTSVADMRRLATGGEIERLPAPILKTWLRSNGVAATGLKPALVDRVYTLLE